MNLSNELEKYVTNKIKNYIYNDLTITVRGILYDSCGLSDDIDDLDSVIDLKKKLLLEVLEDKIEAIKKGIS
jgi:hypothetical protein